jgi:hypothetical protein
MARRFDDAKAPASGRTLATASRGMAARTSPLRKRPPFAAPPPPPPAGAASEAAAASALSRLLSRLEASGYACGWQLVWADTPGGWPPDWHDRAPGFIGPDGAPAAPGDLPDSDSPGSGPGPRPLAFQIKVLRPADIEASVALRSEDDGFWARHVSAMVKALLAAGGWRADASEYFYQVGLGPRGG